MSNMQRRNFLKGFIGTSMFFETMSQVEADLDPPPIFRNYSSEIRDVLKSAPSILGPGIAAATTAQPDTFDLAQVILQALDKGDQDTAAADLASQTGALLGALTVEEKDLRLYDDTEGESIAAANPYEGLRPKYNKFVQTLEVISSHEPELKKAAAFICSDSAKRRYMAASAASTKKIPWFMIGALHYREANLNFLTHLYNGDPLLSKTTYVPPNKPPGTWLPLDADGRRITDPNILWQSSAVDALNEMRVAPNGWTAAGICWTLECYNGFGYELRMLIRHIYGIIVNTTIITLGRQEAFPAMASGVRHMSLGRRV